MFASNDSKIIWAFVNLFELVKETSSSASSSTFFSSFSFYVLLDYFSSISGQILLISFWLKEEYCRNLFSETSRVPIALRNVFAF